MGKLRYVERWTCDQQFVDSNPTRGESCITTLGKLFTHLCASVTKQYNLAPAKAVMLCGCESNRNLTGLAESNGSLPSG